MSFLLFSYLFVFLGISQKFFLLFLLFLHLVDVKLVVVVVGNKLLSDFWSVHNFHRHRLVCFSDIVNVFSLFSLFLHIPISICLNVTNKLLSKNCGSCYLIWPSATVPFSCVPPYWIARAEQSGSRGFSSSCLHSNYVLLLGYIYPRVYRNCGWETLDEDNS